MLHFVTAHSTALTGAGTEDTFAGSAFSPTGEGEVQERAKEGGLPFLIGISAVLGDVATVSSATGGPYYRVEMNTWEQARYIKRPWNAWANANAGGAPVISGTDQEPIMWFDRPIALDRDADFTVKTMATSNLAAGTVALFESYGPRIPWAGQADTWRMVTGGEITSVNTWATLGSISDLDPRLTYRLSTLIGVAEDQPLHGIRLRGPSNSTYAGCLCNQLNATSAQPVPWKVDLTVDSIYIYGVDTVAIEALVDGAQKPSVYVGLTTLGGTMTGKTTTSTGPAGSGTGRLLPSGGGGTLQKIIGSLAGR
jgi:hypothetical protein